MSWKQVNISLKAKKRGCHLVTEEILSQLPQLSTYRVGLAHFFLQHSSASLTLNENYDSDVRKDMEMMLNRIVPANAPYTHTMEGDDDMPGHVKSSLFGVSVSIPIRDGKLALGTWQGIWLGEHRDHGGSRHLVVTLQGEVNQ
ncbi:MAG: hypothetical protein DHS80DRAFT_12802 [Piptocephalis tieghemiana]|nr:MAG: hypothetical protein DHS80DRAFT_12802 [Piptocephalis tieghemiana]